MSHRPRIYLAGPEVFLPDALAVGQAKVALCAAHDCEGIFPLDASLDLTGLKKHEAAARISAANEGLMRTCDALVANLTPFRGVSMDSGTAFEVGFMRALGRPVFGYSNVAGDYKRRADAYRALRIGLPDADAPDTEVEDFGLEENLMIAVAIVESGGSMVARAAPAGQEMRDLAGFEACLLQVQRVLGA
ncbi:MAG: nucleoside 2-deoxyribosyltransferase [Hyphomicrobiaceae bacterium]